MYVWICPSRPSTLFFCEVLLAHFCWISLRRANTLRAAEEGLFRLCYALGGHKQRIRFEDIFMCVHSPSTVHQLSVHLAFKCDWTRRPSLDLKEYWRKCLNRNDCKFR